MFNSKKIDTGLSGILGDFSILKDRLTTFVDDSNAKILETKTTLLTLEEEENKARKSLIQVNKILGE